MDNRSAIYNISCSVHNKNDMKAELHIGNSDRDENALERTEKGGGKT